MNILILGRTLKEKKEMNWDIFFQNLSMHKNLNRIKNINIYFSDLREPTDTDDVETHTYKKFNIKMKYIGGPWESLEHILYKSKIQRIDVVVNDHSTMKFMDKLTDSKFFVSKYVTRNTVIFLRDMDSQLHDDNWQKFEISELIHALNKMDNKCNIVKCNIVHGYKKGNIEICLNWTGRELRAYLYYLSHEEKYFDKTLTEKDISTEYIIFAGNKIQDNVMLSKYDIISGSTLHFGNSIKHPNANWLKIKIQLKNNNFTCGEYKHSQKNDNYILTHPNDDKKHFCYNVCKFKDATNSTKTKVNGKTKVNEPIAKNKRCPNGTRRDPTTKECVKKQ